MEFNLDSHPLIGMIHLPNLISNDYDIEAVIEYAKIEAAKLDDLKYSGIMLENFSDSPFVKSRVSDLVLSKMSIIAYEVKKSISIPLGVNILRNASTQALSVATASNLDFIRVNIWEGAYVTDQGIIEGAAEETIRLKRSMQSSVKILADIHVKHAYPLVQFSVLESAENAVLRGKADAIIMSGISTGREADLDKIKEVSDHGFKPLIGSGINHTNVSKYADYIRGAIVGTSIKIDNNVLNVIDPIKAEEMINVWNDLF